MKALIILMAAMLSLQVHAQRRGGTSTTGNGGDVVDCGPNEPLLLLDVYEMTKIRKRKMIIESFAGTAEQKRNELLQVIENTSPYQARLLKKEIQQFHKNRTLTKEELPDIPDSQHIFIPENCKIRQIVIQKRVNGVSTFEINEELLNRLDENNKAALDFHEAVYSDGIDLRQENSIPTRAYASYLLEGKLQNLNEARTQLSFYAIHDLKNGDTFFMKPYQYRDFKAAQGKANQNVLVCGVSLARGLNLPCLQDFIIRFDDEQVLSMAESSSLPWGSYNRILNMPFDIKKVSFKESFVVPTDSIDFKFDGIKFTCRIFEPIYLPLTNPKVENINACAVYGGGLLRPFTKLAQRLEFPLPSYDAIFLRRNGKALGVRYNVDSRSNSKWRYSFTPREDLSFNSYEENWVDQQVTLRGLSGTLVYQKKDGSMAKCHISDEATFDMKGIYPELLQGPDYKKQPCEK